MTERRPGRGHTFKKAGFCMRILPRTLLQLTAIHVFQPCNRRFPSNSPVALRI